MTTTQEAGRLGAEARNAKYSPEQRSEISQKAAATRKEHDPQAFSKMGQKGGGSQHSQRGTGKASSEDEEGRGGRSSGQGAHSGAHRT